MIPWIVKQKINEIKNFIETLWIQFSKNLNSDLLLTVFIHKSFSSDFKEPITNNERLEFLWDWILGWIINKLLYEELPNEEESVLTLYKIALVREENLAKAWREIGIQNYIFLGNWEQKSWWKEKAVIIADAVEALIWYIFIDIWYEQTEFFVKKFIFKFFSEIKTINAKSYKTIVQEEVQKTYKSLPEYKDSEYEKDEKGNCVKYKAELRINNEKKTEWFWQNKKKAQEDAAKARVDIQNENK